jgi:hypothetical protein
VSRARHHAAPRLAPWLATSALLAGSLLASCTKLPPPGDLEALQTTAQRGADHRERSLAALESRMVVRLSGRATGRLPAVSVQTKLASPDRARLQARSILGVLLDAAVRGDTLVAWMPSQRLGVRIPDLADSLGVREPALFLGRALAASWQAPAEAWRAATPDSAGVKLAWQDGDEAWTLWLDRMGRPRQLEVDHEAHVLTVGYPQWRGAGLGAWPQRIELADGEGWVHARVDMESSYHAKKARPAWFVVSLPEDVTPVALEDLRRVIEKVRRGTMQGESR